MLEHRRDSSRQGSQRSCGPAPMPRGLISMKATFATFIGVLSLAAAGAVGAFVFEKNMGRAPSRPAPASILAGDRAAKTDRRSAPGNSLEDRASAAVENAAEALNAILGDQTVQRTDPTGRLPVFDVVGI